MIIASEEVVETAYGPDEDGKWQGVITHSHMHERHPGMILLSTNFSYLTEDEAVEDMKKSVANIRKAVAAETTAT
jgi:hypothetical protein